MDKQHTRQPVWAALWAATRLERTRQVAGRSHACLMLVGFLGATRTITGSMDLVEVNGLFATPGTFGAQRRWLDIREGER